MVNLVRPSVPLAAMLLATACGVDDGVDLDLEEVGQAISGYDIVTRETASDASVTKQLAVACRKGRVALGAGWAALDPTGAIGPGKVTYFSPGFDGASWLTNVTAPWPGSTWKLRVSVVCAPRPRLYEVVDVETALDTVSSKQVIAACPSGKVAVGAGFGVLDATNVILDGEATHFMASFDAAHWLINARGDAGGTPWKLRGRVLCVPPSIYPTLSVVTEDTPLDALSMKQAITACPAGLTVASSGWGALDGSDVILEGAGRHSMPAWDGLSWMTNVEVFAGLPWKVRARTLCL